MNNEEYETTTTLHEEGYVKTAAHNYSTFLI